MAKTRKELLISIKSNIETFINNPVLNPDFSEMTVSDNDAPVTDFFQDILDDIDPFTLHFDKPHASPNRKGVAYPITPQAPIDHLKERLHTASVFAGKVYQRRTIPAHMTIAEFISIQDGLTLCAQLQDSGPSGSFLCDRLQFIIPDQDFHFQRVDTFFLGKGSRPV